jgi:glycosyltransferase involved in cell wall biosynthesis/SAM-dependent methyltransferase
MTTTSNPRADAERVSVSVLIPTRDEERNIRTCLDAVAWADDVIVFDSLSTDATQSIAKAWGARVVERGFDDFATHKNWALDNIDFRHDWILIVDADERITPELALEIEATISDTTARNGYYIVRKNIFLGRWVRHADMYPDHNLRLFRHGHCRYERRIVHEHMVCDGEPGVLKNPLEHEDDKGIERYVARHNTYSSLEAVATHRAMMLGGSSSPSEDGIRANLFGNGPQRRRALKQFAYRHAPARAFIVFAWMYIVKLGFLDGRLGLRYCLLRFFYEMQADLKLAELRDPTSAMSRQYAHYLETDDQEDVPCLDCGGATVLALAKVTDTRFGVDRRTDIRKCLTCSLSQSAPLPTRDELDGLYAAHYNFAGADRPIYRRVRELFFNMPFYGLWLALDGDASFHAKRGAGRLLDLGCNEGRNLDFFRRAGFETEGLEPNPNAARVARQRGHVIHESGIEVFEPDQPYDVVVLSQVLEHALDPVDMLRHTRRLLAPGGEVWIGCPNVNSGLARLFGRRWINWHTPFHICHFDRRTLRRVIERAGFEVLEERQETPALWSTQSVLTGLTAKPGQPTLGLRNPLLVASLMLAARLVLFPLSWWLNRNDQGDCLIVTARRS